MDVILCSEDKVSNAKRKELIDGRISQDIGAVSVKKQYSCNIPDCTWSFATKSKLERHKQSHSNEKHFRCDFQGCGRKFKCNSNLKHHRKLVHESPGKYLCTAANCDASFHSQKWLDFHTAEHEGAVPSYSCQEPNCGKAFFTRNSLCSHMKRHERKTELRCQICGKEFEIPCRLRTHIQGHENERPYPCTVPGCHWTFPSQSKLGRHMNHHLKIRRFACTFPKCFKAFLRQDHLTDHMKTHLNVKVFRCPIEMCDAVFEARKLVQSHIQQVHGKKEEKTPKSPNRNSLLGSARTSITYLDVAQQKGKIVGLENHEDNVISTAIVNDTLDADVQPHPNDILQNDNLSPPQQDLMLTSANLVDTSAISLQEELLNQDCFLLDASNRLADFEPSTINLRDLGIAFLG